jgi:hypothetical protein
MDVQTFLTALAAKRRAEQARERSAFTLPTGFRVPWDLERAIQHRWLVQPVLAQSIYASAAARVGVPDNTPAQIESWAAQYRSCNWELTTGRDSGVIGVEMDMRLAWESLRLVSEDFWEDLESTLWFEAGCRRMALFSYAENLPRIGRPFADYFKLYTNGKTILIPPSCLAGSQLAYRNSSSPATVPAWLFYRCATCARADLTKSA